MVKRSLIVLYIAAFTASCAYDDEPDTHVLPRDHVSQSQAIKGGVNAPNDSATVGMYSFGGICSGTLIAPNLVLTAQHCVARTATEYVICGQTTFGSVNPANQIFITTQPYLTNNANNYHGVAEVLVPPGSREMCGYDMALLILRDNVEESEAVPLVPRVDEPLRTGEVYASLGYGHVGDGSGTGVRRIIENRRVQCAGTSCPAYASVTETEFLGTEGTCQGDSGGTARDEKGRVIGALSRGPNGCAASVYSDVYPWADWLREVGGQAAERGGYEPHIWVTHGLTEIPEDDIDLDGITIDLDNCPNTENPEQIDTDQDGNGDACDFNQDEDTIEDDMDNCPLTDNDDQFDFDLDGFGDACDDDDDDDGVLDQADFCPKDGLHFEYDSPCGTDTGVVVLLDDGNKGCATQSGGQMLPTLFALFGFILLGRRRREA